MVRKRKDSPFDRDAFAPASKVERVDHINLLVKHHKSQSFTLGLIAGFVLNTILAVILVSVQSEIDYRNSQAGLDKVLEVKINDIVATLTDMEQYATETRPGVSVKEINEAIRKELNEDN